MTKFYYGNAVSGTPAQPTTQVFTLCLFVRTENESRPAPGLVSSNQAAAECTWQFSVKLRVMAGNCFENK